MAASKRVRFETTKCSDDADIVSGTPWSDEPPSIFIAFPGRIVCYEGTRLRLWLSDPDNTSFYKWVPQYSGGLIDDSGGGGKPSTDPRDHYWKLYTQEYVVADEGIRRKIMSEESYLFDAVPIGVERTGKAFGMSGEHGQLPGRTIYKLTNPRQVQVVSNPDIDKLREMKTYEDVIGQVPLDIAAKYPIAILMVAREKYLSALYAKHSKLIIDTTPEVLKRIGVDQVVIQSEMPYHVYANMIHELDYPTIFTVPIDTEATVAISLLSTGDDRWMLSGNAVLDYNIINTVDTSIPKKDAVMILDYLMRVWEFDLNVPLTEFIKDAATFYDEPNIYFDPYFTDKEIDFILGMKPSAIASRFYFQHEEEVLDRLLQLFARKPLEMPGAKKSKTASPKAASPKRVKSAIITR